MRLKFPLFIIIISCLIYSCNNNKEKRLITASKQKTQLTAKEILGNPDYLAISYGGYRKTTRGIQPTITEIKEDMKILHAMNIKILRTYNVQFAQAETILKAIKELKSEDASFEMYVMLGAWIDCKNAWTGNPVNHQIESDQNEGEIARAVSLANTYPNIVKIIAVGNEAMVKWATNYYVEPSIILKWVSHLQDLKKKNKCPELQYDCDQFLRSPKNRQKSLLFTTDFWNLLKSRKPKKNEKYIFWVLQFLTFSLIESKVVV